MASSSILLYVLLAIWLLPAVLMIAVYCTDAAWDWARWAFARWNCYWAQRAIRQRADARTAVTLRRSVVVTGRVATIPAVPQTEPTARRRGRAPYVVAGNALHVPLVLEDETGRLHLQQWTLGLN